MELTLTQFRAYFNYISCVFRFFFDIKLKFFTSIPFVFKSHGHLLVEAYTDHGYYDYKGDKKSSSGYFTYLRGLMYSCTPFQC